jgi:Uma2 family endonuclease
MSTIATLLTAEDLLNLPPDNMRHELVRGELTTMAPTSDEHGSRAARITVRVGHFIEENKLGEYFVAETGFLLARKPDTVRAPDFAFVARERMARQGFTKKFWPGAPDFVVEVLSPSDSASEVLEKIDEWLSAGTRLVWLVDPQKKTIRIFAPKRPQQIVGLGGMLDGGDVLPGLRVAVSEIFG